MDAVEKARQLDREGRCIVCGRKDNARRRGLCDADYSKFVRVMAKAPDDVKDALEKLLIARGQLLESRRGKRTQENPFEDALNEVLGKTFVETQGSRSSADAEALADQLVADAEEVQEKARRSTPKKRRKRSGAKKS